MKRFTYAAAIAAALSLAACGTTIKSATVPATTSATSTGAVTATGTDAQGCIKLQRRDDAMPDDGHARQHRLDRRDRLDRLDRLDRIDRIGVARASQAGGTIALTGMDTQMDVKLGSKYDPLPVGEFRHAAER